MAEAHFLLFFGFVLRAVKRVKVREKGCWPVGKWGRTRRLYCIKYSNHCFMFFNRTVENGRQDQKDAGRGRGRGRGWSLLVTAVDTQAVCYLFLKGHC